MNSEISTIISKINDSDTVNLFLDSLKSIILNLNLNSNDERLSLNIRSDAKKRFSVCINSRLVFGLTNKSQFYLMIADEDFEKINPIKLEKIEDFDKKNPPSKLILISKDDFFTKKDLLLPLIIKVCSDYLPTQKKSPYRKYHSAELYEIMMNQDLRNVYYENMDPVKEMIFKYKQIIKQTHLSGEIYKWQLLNKFEGRPNLENPDLYKELKSIDYSNLMYPIGKGVMFHIAREKAGEYKKILENLFDENQLLNQRIKNTSISIDKLYKEFGNGKPHHHDERTISTLLTFKYPNKYIFFKDSFYKKYCKIIGENPEKKGLKFSHYLKLINDLVENYIKEDSELINLINSDLPPDAYKNDNYKILAQDILYQILDQQENIEIPTSEEVVEIKNVKKFPLNQILYGPPGTGKTYHTINKAINICNPNFDLSQDRKLIKTEYQRLVDEGRIVFTTFHQSMSYEDFIEGIKPKIQEDEDEKKNVIYEVENGIFKKTCQHALEKKDVEEIDNFDESWENLLELVKEQIKINKLLKIGSWEYSLSTKNSLKYSSINSPSQYTFTITKQNILDTYQNKIARPSGAFQKDMEDVVQYMKKNLHLSDYSKHDNYVKGKIELNQNYVMIIDEINRGNVSQIFGELITLIEEDKRLGNPESLEITLPYSKEKFGVPANLFIIGTMNTADRSVEALDTALRRRFSFEEMRPIYDLEELDYEIAGIDVSEILQTINARIEKLIDKDHEIGHAYFIGKNQENMMDSFYRNIIPLLQEYFFGDYAKMGLVLGKGFVKTVENNEKIFADFDYDESIDFENNETFEIINYQKNTDFNGFEIAIKQLMNIEID